MIDDAAKTETIDEIFIVGGTHETTSDVSAANIKENIAQLLRKAKTLTPTITVSSVLPSKRRANPDRRADVNMKMKEACNEVDVKFVDNDANFTFRNGAADDAAFQRDGLHLSESGVGRLLLNLSLPEQPPKQNKRQHQQQHRHVSNATNHDRLPNARVAPPGKWTVVKRRLVCRWASVPNAVRRTTSLPPADTLTKCCVVSAGNEGIKKSITPVIRKWA
ncbi:hypothetical protein NP493_7728g00002 [Ridgeia piscesae]|uniref:SGNH hydrolase-type esterase domain-containing protein n=1 Tax=Ridgeia piscesae TaxID=27915 RepID=A0AAD9INX1_RIDPI|nr:hypothetical protein NP493_7728g00002 [Ridgeia piscesae]